MTSVIAFLLLLSAIAPQSLPVLRGNWSATVGSREVLQGVWSAEITPASPNAAKGSWALLNNANQIVLQGAWSAVRSQRSWKGTWSARVFAPGRSGTPVPSGRVMSGSWQADAGASTAKTLSDLLQEALQTQVDGAWGSGALRGRWSLKGSR